jgi:peptide/nickel transport system permease protein
MFKYILRRLIQAIPTFFGITILAYLIMDAAPGSPARLLTFGARTTPQQVRAVEAQLGLNDPIHVQYLRWLLGDDWMRWDSNGDGIADHAVIIPLDADGDGVPEKPGDRLGIIRGDFGRSFSLRQPALRLIGQYVGATIELSLTALLLGLVTGVPIGILAAVRKGGYFDNFTRIMAVVFNAIPIFWLGLILILIFGVWLKQPDGTPLLPMGGRCDPMSVGGCPPLPQRLEYILLPALVLATGGIAVFSRYMRASMLDVINQDFIRTARSKGLANRTVWFKHAARNALIPIATILGPSVTGLLSGAVITETIFSWPGMGRFAFTAVQQQDYPVVMAVVIISAVTTIIGFILSDILYAIVDPRIRFN